MLDNYSGGYHKAILDLYNFFQGERLIDHYCKSKKQYKECVVSLLKLLAEDEESRTMFACYTPLVWIKQEDKTGRIVKIADTKEGLME